ncbi:MAG: thioredoxin family protein [Bdellovibrionota bacterium]
MKLSVIVLILFCTMNLFAAESEMQRRDHVIVSLIADHDQISSNQDFKVGLKFIIEKGWHIYWKNPGDSGTAPKIKWEQSKVQISSFSWPTPHIFHIEPLANYGYEKEVIFPMEVKFSGNNFQLAGEASWLVCKIECIPGKAQLKLTIPVGEEEISFSDSKEIEKYLSLKAIATNDIKLSLDQDASTFKLKFSSEDMDLKSFEKAYFFPNDGTYIAHAAPQEMSTDKNHIELTIKKSDSLTENPEFIDGVLALEKKGEPRLSFEVSSEAKGAGLSLWMALAFAFLGGLILNLMPCVFPVISIKILGFVDSSQKTNTEISNHGWAYTAGVLLSFLILSGALLILRSLGQSLGWGFQLQSPYFVIFMMVLFFLIALNLWGVFEIGENLAGVGNKVSRQKGYGGSFFTGILATLVATPCTAPFMGSALGFAITLPPIQSVFIFLMLGFGMAVPYLILSYFPSWIRKLPKPGPWMITFKKILAIPMLLTVVWLGWVLSLQLQSPENIKNEGAWISYSETELQKLRDEGAPVFVDFTAAWCITCQVNKKVVLNTDKIQLAFKEAGVVLMKADWTNQDPVITKALAAFDRNSVPLYILYTKNKDDKPLVLPEILTDDIVLNSLKKL